MRAVLIDTETGREVATWRGMTIVAEDEDATLLVAQFADALHPEPTEAPEDGIISFAAWLALTREWPEEEKT